MSSVISAGEGSQQDVRGGTAHSQVGDTTQTTGNKVISFAAPNRDGWQKAAIYAGAGVLALIIWTKAKRR